MALKVEFQPIHDDAPSSFDINEVYAADPLVETHEIAANIKNKDGEIIGNHMRLKLPDANANYSAPRFNGTNPLLGRLVGNLKKDASKANKEAFALMPTREEDTNATSQRLQKRLETNVAARSSLSVKGDVKTGAQDATEASFYKGGHDMRSAKERAGYAGVSHRNVNADIRLPIRKNAKFTPVEAAPIRGRMAVRDPKNFPEQHSRSVPRSQEDADTGKIGEMHMQYATSKRAVEPAKTRTNTEVMVARQDPNRPFDETTHVYTNDVSVLPTSYNNSERPVLGAFQIRNSSHTLIDFMPPEMDQAGVSLNTTTPTVSQRFTHEAGDGRPLPFRGEYREADINTHIQTALEKKVENGVFDKTSSKRMYDNESDRVNGGNIYDNPKGVGDLGADDSLHTARDSDANVEGISKRKNERFDYETRISVGGRGLVHQDNALFGQQERFSSKKLRDPNNVLGRTYLTPRNPLYAGNA